MHTSRPETNSCACWYQRGRRRFTGVGASQDLRTVNLEGHGSARLLASTCGDKHLAGWWDLATFILEHGRMTRLPLLPRPFLGAIDQPWEILTKQSGKPRHRCRPVACVEDVIDGDCAGRGGLEPGTHMELQQSRFTWLRSTTVSCNCQRTAAASMPSLPLRIQYLPSAGGSTPTAFNFKPATFLCLCNNTTPLVPTITNSQPLHNSSLHAMPRLSEHAKLERLASAPTNRMWSSPPRR